MRAFKARLTKPEKGNPYYNTKSNGGYSSAIKGKPTDPDCDVLSNCVGYAYGRFNEIGSYGYCKYLKPVNAENFIQYCGGLPVGQTPRLGACMVWQKGATLSGSDGAGHVAIVEKVISQTEVVTSESGWGNPTPFYTATRKKGADGNWGQSYKFLGFIYNPAVTDEPAPEPEPQPQPQPADKIEVGDVVDFTGDTHYGSSSADVGFPCKPGRATVTKIVEGSHPYHLIHTPGGESTVYGWVNASDIRELSPKPVESPEEGKPQQLFGGFRVQVGAFSNKDGAERKRRAVEIAGFTPVFLACTDSKLWRVQVGPYETKKEAEGVMAQLKAAGFTSYVTTLGGDTTEYPPKPVLKEGSLVKLRSGALYYDGKVPKPFVYDRVHEVKQIIGSRAVITYNGGVTGAVNASDLILIS